MSLLKQWVLHHEVIQIVTKTALNPVGMLCDSLYDSGNTDFEAQTRLELMKQIFLKPVNKQEI